MINRDVKELSLLAFSFLALLLFVHIDDQLNDRMARVLFHLNLIILHLHFSCEQSHLSVIFAVQRKRLKSMRLLPQILNHIPKFKANGRVLLSPL